MGTSIDADIGFGIAFEDTGNFPWETKEFDYEIEKWWIYGVNGYKDPFQLYNKEGNYFDETSESKSDEWYKSLDDFKKSAVSG